MSKLLSTNEDLRARIESDSREILRLKSAFADITEKNQRLEGELKLSADELVKAEGIISEGFVNAQKDENPGFLEAEISKKLSDDYADALQQLKDQVKNLSVSLDNSKAEVVKLGEEAEANRSRSKALEMAGSATEDDMKTPPAMRPGGKNQASATLPLPPHRSLKALQPVAAPEAPTKTIFESTEQARLAIVQCLTKRNSSAPTKVIKRQLAGLIDGAKGTVDVGDVFECFVNLGLLDLPGFGDDSCYKDSFELVMEGLDEDNVDGDLRVVEFKKVLEILEESGGARDGSGEEKEEEEEEEEEEEGEGKEGKEEEEEGGG